MLFAFAGMVTALVLLGLIYSDVHAIKTADPPTPASETELTQATNCSGIGTTLSASKTAATFEIQTDTYTWNVTKSSVTQLTTIPLGQCAFLPPFEVDAVRVLSSRTFRTIINGTITVTNGGAVATAGLSITDMLQVQSGCTSGGFVNFFASVVDVTSHPVLQPGETWNYYYELDTALMTGYDPACHYRNAVFVTITNHAGWLPGCPGQCPGPAVCPFGPNPKADVVPSEGITLIEINEEAAIHDYVACPPGFTCTSAPSGDILIPTQDVCTFNDPFALCTLLIQVCNVNASCDTNLTIADYVQLVTQNEATPLIVTSNTVLSPVYTGACAVGCTLTIGYWKTHAGFTGNNADRVTQYLPILLGCPPPQYAKGANVTSASQSTGILTFNALLGGASDGLNKLAAQLLGAKLNVANGATAPPAVASLMASANALLCQYGFNAGAWSSLGSAVRSSINQAASALDNYNNGLSGVPHCQ